MRVAIHQPNYLPWMGFFNKIAKSDLFIIMDDVQMSDSGMFQRNRVLNKNGEISFLTMPFVKEGYMEKSLRQVELRNTIDWQKRQYNFLWDAYHKFPAWNEVYKEISPLFEEHFTYLFDVNQRAIRIVCFLLGIKTPLITMSSLEYDHECKRNNLVLNLCRIVGGDTYLSGNGARKYMEIDTFKQNGINVQYQSFIHPMYTQKYSLQKPILGLSILDVFLNCGIKETSKLFWDNLQNNEINE